MTYNCDQCDNNNNNVYFKTTSFSLVPAPQRGREFKSTYVTISETRLQSQIIMVTMYNKLKW